MTSVNTCICILCGYNAQKTCSYVRFPKNELRRKEWVTKCGLNKRTNVLSARLCAKHFLPDDFNANTAKRRRLNNTAVPSIFFQHKFSSSKNGNTVQTNKKPSDHYCVICKVRTIQSTCRLPKNELERQKWIKHFNIRRNGDLSNIRICRQHIAYSDPINQFMPCHQRRSKVLIDNVRKVNDCDGEVGQASPEDVFIPEIVIESPVKKIVELKRLHRRGSKMNSKVPGQ